MTVARCPHATYRILGAQTQTRMTAHDIVCAHTMAGYLLSTDTYFRITNGPGFRGTESHYGIGGKWGPDVRGETNLDGTAYQWQDRGFTADANYEGKGRVISIETADNAVRPIEPWTANQLDKLVDIIAWECSLPAHAACPGHWKCRQGEDWRGIRVAIPPVLVPDSKPSRRGIAYHRQGCEHVGGLDAAAGWLVTGGERWSTSRGKDCPTNVRIAQLTAVVVPRVQSTLLKPTAGPVEVHPMADMSEADMDKLAGKIADRIAGKVIEGASETVGSTLATLGNNMHAAVVELRGLRADLKEGGTP